MINSFTFSCDWRAKPSEFCVSNKEKSEEAYILSWADYASLRYTLNGKFDKDSYVLCSDTTCSLRAGFLFDVEGSNCMSFTEANPDFGFSQIGGVLSCHRGSFCGLSVDLKKGQAIFYSDQLASMPLYYYFDGSFLCCGTSVFAIASELKVRKKLEVCLAGAYCLVSYAYMLHDFTLFDGIKRVLPGSAITVSGWDDPQISCENYYSIDNKAVSVDEQEALHNVDHLFLQAIERQAALNARYGYGNLCALSAGLDSRMCAFALRRIEAYGMETYTYSQLMQPDFDIPKKICYDMNWRWLFKNLDGGWDLARIDDSIAISNGTNYYPWASQLTDFLDSIELGQFGLVHTGVIGDVVLGTFLDYRNNQQGESYELGDGAYSQKLIYRLQEMATDLKLPVRDYELGMLYNRGINGACLGYSLSFNRKMAASSPFMDIDFFTYCMHIPTTMRKDHNLYYKWVVKYYPEAAKYLHNGAKIPTVRASVPYRGRRLPMQSIPGLIKRKLSHKSIKNSMNPMEWWYTTNGNLKTVLDGYYFEHRDVLAFDSTLKSDVDNLYATGSALEKTLCISLVGSLARFK